VDIEAYRTYCLNKKGVTEAFPFDDNVLVFKVMGKIFALTDVAAFSSINLKCDPSEAVELREAYDAVIPGYHMNKKHWNTVVMDNSLPDKLILSWIDKSYELVASSLTKRDKLALGAL
jgi:predicted DNA-binding protein (MmcQ/YjbR family)